MSAKPNAKRPVEIYDLRDDIYVALILAEDGTANDAKSKWIKANGSFCARLEENADGRVSITGNAALTAFLAINRPESVPEIGRVGDFHHCSVQLRNAIAICVYGLRLMKSLAKDAVAQ